LKEWRGLESDSYTIEVRSLYHLKGKKADTQGLGKVAVAPAWGEGAAIDRVIFRGGGAKDS
jgi:hypothetical protein